MEVISEIKKNGYCLIKNVSQKSLNRILNTVISSLNVSISRDIIVTTNPKANELAAHREDFWFHSDATFIPIPPKLVIIHLLEDDSKSCFEIMDTTGISLVQNPYLLYGQKGTYIVSQTIIEHNNEKIFRYRKDFTTSLDDNSDSEFISSLVNQFYLSGNFVPINLDVKDLIIIDNWKLLHRRGELKGPRSIRRIWLNSND